MRKKYVRLSEKMSASGSELVTFCMATSTAIVIEFKWKSTARTFLEKEDDEMYYIMGKFIQFLVDRDYLG